jgi:8-amino-7-oxononanoate synthase
MYFNRIQIVLLVKFLKDNYDSSFCCFVCRDFFGLTFMNQSPICDRIHATLLKKKQSNLFRKCSEYLPSGAIDFSTNSYLSLHTNIEIAESARKLAQNRFHGNCASRIISSESSLFEELESEIASWEHTEAALVFNSGYAANTGIIQALCSRDTVVFCDRLNHASIMDGITLSRAKLVRYMHNDMSDLEKKLFASNAKEKIIITDTVFSMDGDCAKLSSICDLAQKFNCMVMVDEAHATGVFGKTGAGITEELGFENKIDIRMGTLSKSVAGLGGYFAGSAETRDYLVNCSRSLIYSTALPHAALAWNLAAIRHIRSHQGMGKELLFKAQQLRAAMHKKDFDVMKSDSQIVPCQTGDEASALSLSAFLKKNNIIVPAIRPPTVPANTARIRLSVHSAITDEHIELLVDAIKKWRTSNEI